MFVNYLKITYRNLIRHKGYSFINIFGLSVGISCCILILLFLKDELSFDQFHENSDRIFRVVSKYTFKGNTKYHAGMPAPLTSAILNEYKDAVKITRFGAGNGDVIRYGNIQTKGNRFELADPNIFDVFTIPLFAGNSQTALNDPNSIVISESLAKKYFVDKSPIGKILQIGKEDFFQDYKVTGAFKDLPANSHLKFDCLASFQAAYIKGNEGNLTWGANNYETFILLQNNFPKQRMENVIKQIFEKHSSFPGGLKYDYFLQPLTSIHLDPNPGNKLPTERDSDTILILTGIGLLILLIACINFINLATAQASMREKEVGVRKVVGANRLQLANQFLGESVILSLLAFVIAIPMVEALLPAFNQYADKNLTLFSYDNVYLILVLPLMTILTGVIAGSYPAIFISSFQPVSILHGRLYGGKTNTKSGLRSILVIAQFVVSIIFIVSTLIMNNQLQFIKNKNLGYNKDHIVVVPIYGRSIKAKYQIYKTEILRNASVINATASSYLPSEQGYNQNVYFKGPAEGKMDYMSWIPVDEDFISTIGLNLTSGKNFSKDYSNERIGYILNESAVKQIGWKNPIGEPMNIIGWGNVIGVIKDFHFQSLRNKIEPLALCIYPEAYQYLHVRIKPEDISNTLGFLEKQWKEIFPDKIFEYNFFDEDFNKLYKTEIRLHGIFNFITALSMLVACLGLFGLVHYSTERRTKEIGIRKILGSTIPNVIVLLLKDFVRWVLLANVIAFPVAYYFMNIWLQDYAYRIEISLWMFVLAGLITLVIALSTVGYHAIKVAIANPVESLKYE